MYTGFLHTHSLLRYLILFLLVLIIVRLLMYRGTFGKQNEKLALWLMIITHVQLLLGIGLAFLSPHVHYNSLTMKEPQIRYWSVEHLTMMIVVVVLITLARVYSRKPIQDKVKRRRVLGLTTGALLLIVLTLYMSGRGIIIPASDAIQ